MASSATLPSIPTSIPMLHHTTPPFDSRSTNSLYTDSMTSRSSRQFHADLRSSRSSSHGGQQQSTELVWVPDDQSFEEDKADQMWRSLEVKLGRPMREFSRKERGRCALQRSEHGPAVRFEAREGTAREGSERDWRDVRRDPGDDHSTDRLKSTMMDQQVPSHPSSPGAIPAMGSNSNPQSTGLQRSRRVRPIRRQSRSFSRSASLAESDQQRPTRSQDPGSGDSSAVAVYSQRPRFGRLDSHIVQALASLQADYDTPTLSSALSGEAGGPCRGEDGCIVGGILMDSLSSSDDLGLGLGLNMRFDSVYSLTVRKYA